MTWTRRQFLAGTLGVTALAGFPVKASSTLAVPAVDRLAITVVTDGSVFGFAEPVRRPDLLVERRGRGFTDPRRTLMAEFGLSLAARSWRADEQRTVLVDCGYTPQVWRNNAELLGIDPAEIDAVVISHGHLDHFGGLTALLEDQRRRRGMPIRVGGEEAFCERQRTTSGTILSFGTLDRHAIEAAGLAVQVEPAPSLLGGHGFTTGSIPFVTAERPLVPTRMLPGQGCRRSELAPAKRDLDSVQDDAIHELGTAYHVRDRGLVVIGSCSHRGILNTIRQAQAASGIDRVHAVIGGFHLVLPQTPAQAEETALRMAEVAPDYVVPGHCTGEAFISAAERLMPGRVIRPYVGTTFTFGHHSGNNAA
jgi:7,8-dihydropterin-6-yl-methyl-4-(beta-D-ribofuranosyl)aminobenzene 5'-phosphate synthase